MPAGSTGAAFTLLGFPVHVRTGFLIFLALVVFINGTDFGLWLALFVAVFTLLHELGHALAARAAGARAEIALDFLYGYAAYVPTRPIQRWERAGISFAGPAVQIVLSVAALLALGVNPLSIDSVADASFMAQALWWAGPVIGAFNLIPVLPFDGGNIAQAGLEYISPRRARDVMLVVSLAITVTAAVAVAVHPPWRPFLLFVLFPLIAQLQLFSATRARSVDDRAKRAAEDRAWITGDTTQFRRGLRPSPWFEAALLLRHGRADDARSRLQAAFDERSPASWAPPSAAPLAELERLVALLGDPLPLGSPACEVETATILAALGEYPRAAEYAARSYAHQPMAATALVVARSAAALGDRGTALGWLRAAQGRGLPAGWELWPEFAGYRGDPEFGELVAST